MNNYAVDSPVKRNVYVPGEAERSSAPVTAPKNPAEIDQSHRRMDWLQHRPQDHAIFPVPPTAVKIEKKKR
jgi:hypothetical protein